MPVVGERKRTNIGSGYRNDPLAREAKVVIETAQTLLKEENLDLFNDFHKIARRSDALNTIKDLFMENSVDKASFGGDSYAYDDHMTMMENQFMNDVEALQEYTPVGSFNPVIGLTFPIHKNILMNNVFDKGAIPKMVAASPKFTNTLETRVMIAPDGTEIDMFTEQHKMLAAVESAAPLTKVTLTLPEAETTDIVTAIGGASNDNLSIETYVSGIYVTTFIQDGDIDPTTGAVHTGVEVEREIIAPVMAKFVPAYGEYDRTMTAKVSANVKLTGGTPSTVSTVLMGYVKNNKIFLNATTADVTKVELSARIDTSSAMVKAPSVAWKTRTDIMEIPSAIPINTTVSADEVKDIAALYQVDQLTKVMSLIKDVLGTIKDDKIKMKLDESFLRIPETNKYATTFDFANPTGYALDHVEHRNKTFMDALDTHVTVLMQVLRDPNMTISVFGRPDLIRKITPTEYTYQSPSNIGPVELDFVKTVTTSDKRTYQFISSDKMWGNNNLIVVLCPRNTDRFIYRIYDYQLYITNEIRNSENPALPAIHAFERWTFEEYQPVQGRIQILNPTGYRTEVPNTDPIGTFEMNDFNANKPYNPNP